MNLKPMKAADLADVGNDFTRLKYPLLLSPKLDGLRGIIWEGVAYSSNAKPLRNKFLQEWAKGNHNLDCELIVDEPTGGEVLGRSMALTAYEGEPNFTCHVFDMLDRVYTGFGDNHSWLAQELLGEPRIQVVPHDIVTTPDEALFLEEQYLSEGYEGVMFRHPDGPYKHGRSTLREGWLIRCKRFIDGEGVVIGLEEAEKNTNAQTRDELGRAKRSSAKAGKVGKGMVGTIIIKDKKWGELRLSPGVMSHAERIMYWSSYAGRSDPLEWVLVGRRVHWRAFGYGVKYKPRFPRFYGLRPKGV